MAAASRAIAALVACLLLISMASGGAAQGTAWDCAAAEATPAGDAVTPGNIQAPAGEPLAFPAAGGELTVFAAASLTDAFETIAADLQAANPGLTITFNFGGSQALVTQLTEGAAADVFASANAAQMNAAIEAGLIADKPRPFVSNRLVVVIPADNPAGISTAADLGAEGLRLVLAQPEVPVGTYSRESICLMAQDQATYGTDFVARVAANVVSEEDDVREVLTKVQLGEADAGVVYVSDSVAAGDTVRLIEIPDDVNVLANYPIAAVAGGDADLSAAFIAYLLSPEGQATLDAFCFGPVP